MRTPNRRNTEIQWPKWYHINLFSAIGPIWPISKQYLWLPSIGPNGRCCGASMTLSLTSYIQYSAERRWLLLQIRGSVSSHQSQWMTHRLMGRQPDLFICHHEMHHQYRTFTCCFQLASSKSLSDKQTGWLNHRSTIPIHFYCDDFSSKFLIWLPCY